MQVASTEKKRYGRPWMEPEKSVAEELRERKYSNAPKFEAGQGERL